MQKTAVGDVMPTNFWRLPFIASDIWEDISDLSPMNGMISGLTVSEDIKNVIAEAAVPGVDPKNIEVSFEKGILWIKGEAEKEEKDGKKYYRKASQSFSYRVAIPGAIDWKAEPVATCKNGIITVTFAKSPKIQPKKITVKAT